MQPPRNWQPSTAGTALSEFMAIDRLDYCGAMTAQMLEGALRHTGTMTNLQAFVGQTTANWVSTGQARLPDGTLWRPTSSDTIWADDLYMSCPFLIRWVPDMHPAIPII